MGSAGAVFLFFAHLDRVKELGFWGLKAQLRDKIDEADEILDYLKDISVPLSNIDVVSAPDSGVSAEQASSCYLR